MPTMFGVEGYQPAGDEEEEGTPRIYPALSMGVKVMSIGFFINPKDALIWRGPMATNALRQLTHQTDWGELDFLLIDMPPGTGDIHLSLMQDLKVFRGHHRQHAAKDRTGRRRGAASGCSGPSKINIPVSGHCRKHGLVHSGRAARKTGTTSSVKEEHRSWPAVKTYRCWLQIPLDPERSRSGRRRNAGRHAGKHLPPRQFYDRFG